ncbi:hypothetical protein HHL22_21405 [Hymenobacter sp. RP-2-7]|uniref:T9SS type A sorting domain-containing protein n=1 Tax=Hymenobacter polaris TaxID=2682546 RepID=A0A7Y0FP83_9BACT|nr:hypothetical protein [Hymenobacter polaris]NML67767.1 hypothetical protein [Hymenobacter polaris]
MRLPLPLFVACLVLTTGVAAQTAPTITAADMPVVGDTLRLSAASIALPASAPPLSLNGANRTWNYADLSAASQRVVRYASVGSVAGAFLQLTFNSPLSPDNRATLAAPQQLPAAAAALPVTDPVEFSALTAADYRLVGYGATFSGTAVPVTYASKAQQDVIYQFPLAYGGAAVVSNSLLATPAALASTGSFSQQRQRSTQADGWGTLTTPFGTFQALRVVSSLLDHDVLTMGTTPSQTIDLPLQREYKWLANGVHVPLLTITTVTVAGLETVTGVEYRDVYRRLVILATRSGALASGLSAYPNPSAAGAALHLAVPAGSEPVAVTATDVVGRVLFSGQCPRAASEVVLDARALGEHRGVLLLTVKTSQGTATCRVVRQ